MGMTLLQVSYAAGARTEVMPELTPNDCGPPKLTSLTGAA